MALPLPVYKGDSYIDPARVNAAIKGALVEVHFCLRHYRIKEKGGNRTIDSFSGLLQQIIILKDGVPKTDSGYYKRKNLLDGPYRPKPFQNSSISAIPSGIVASKSPTGSRLSSPPLPTHLTEDMRVPEAVKTPLVASGSKASDKKLAVPAKLIKDNDGVTMGTKIITTDVHRGINVGTANTAVDGTQVTHKSSARLRKSTEKDKGKNKAD
jgi:hypothetical protein